MLDSFKELIKINPHYGYLIAVGVFLLFLIGFILDWDWVVEPGGGYFNVEYWIRTFGRKTVRIFLGIVMLLGIASCFGLFLYFNSKV